MNERHENTPEQMNEFEQRLTQRMRPVSAPETLAKFLAIAAEAEEKRRRSGRWFVWFKPSSGGGVLVMPRPMAWTVPAMAMAIFLAVFAGEQMHVRRERAQAEVATREFEAATQITDRTLQHMREQLERAGIRLDQ